MNDIILSTQNGEPVASSRDVAKRFGKRHDHVIRDIEELIKGFPKNGDTHMFFKTEYTHEQNGQSYPMYLMNRDGFTLLAMGFTGKAALEWKLKYIAAFNEMEKKLTEQPHPLAAPCNCADRSARRTGRKGQTDCRADTGCRVCSCRVHCRQLPDSHQHRKGLRFDC